ncbi:MAG: sporulation protein YunB [Clostridia bacterium]|nr:sporulation protein YunB [Clostridia bacterium]
MRRHKNRILLAAAAVLLAAVALFTVVELRLKSLRTDFAAVEAENTAASAITKGVDDTLRQYKLNYDDIVDFTYDDGGNIKSLSVDIITLNTFGNEIGKNIDENIKNIESYKVQIPLTLLFGEEFTAGIGLKVPFYITMKGSSSNKFTDIFESAGVNQTRHKIMLEIKVSMYILFGGKMTEIEYKSNICVAESIIIGATPSTFANF